MNARVEKAVTRLVEARRTNEQFVALAPDLQPQSLDEAHAVQNSAIAVSPDGFAWWKIGATSVEIQKLFAIAVPAGAAAGQSVSAH